MTATAAVASTMPDAGWTRAAGSPAAVARPSGSRISTAGTANAKPAARASSAVRSNDRRLSAGAGSSHRPHATSPASTRCCQVASCVQGTVARRLGRHDRPGAVHEDGERQQQPAGAGAPGPRPAAQHKGDRGSRGRDRHHQRGDRTGRRLEAEQGQHGRAQGEAGQRDEGRRHGPRQGPPPPRCAVHAFHRLAMTSD